MRYAAVFALATVLSIQFGHRLFEPAPDTCQQEQDVASGDVCSSEDHSATGPFDIDDRAILQQLSRQGGQLIEDGKTTDLAALIKQLELDRCQLDLPQPHAPPSDGSQLYVDAREGVVVVSSIYKCDRCSKWHATSATGFVISSAGAVVTNHHVVNAADKQTLVVMTADGHVFPVRRVLAASRADDLAILNIDAKGLSPLTIAPEAAPVGSEISVISHPAQRFYCYTSGVVSRYMRLLSDGQAVEGMAITADYARGSSGAPVLNAQGQVVGIVKSTDSIYYSTENGQSKNLQMVFKRCIPATSLLKLITSTAPAKP